MAGSYTPSPAFEIAKPIVVRLHKNHDTALQLLKAYSLFKQTTVGDVEGSKPGVFNQEGRGKFDAWTLAKGTAPQVADALYVNCSKHMDTGEPLNPENLALLERIRAQLRGWF
ncbi:hypothetical protein HOY82DRAFT_608432 [Tuber indicum]|nr:hypothetical protein HOY82DRAFT_608432 [Tuber indicum]